MPHKLSPKIVDALLEKLASDDVFRAQFQSDPRSALASLGDESARSGTMDEQGAWACMTVTQLASKEQIKSSRAELSKQLSAEALFSPFHLQAQ
jgi:putative modified peptide